MLLYEKKVIHNHIYYL